MKSRLKGMEYSFEIDTDEMTCLLRAERLGAFPSLAEKLSGIDGVRKVEYGGHYGEQIVVGFLVGDDQNCVGFNDASKEIRKHLEACERFLIYVGADDDDVRGKTLLHAGEDFVLCNATASDGRDLGVSLHFLENDSRQAKWFVDGAAQQFRELAGQDGGRLRALVAKHIDLDPPLPGIKP